MGALGRRFFSLANGVDAREVVGSRRAHSVGSERTLNVDVAKREEIVAYLRLAADTIAQRLRRSKRRARGVRIKLKTTSFRVLTRQCLLGEATDVAAVLFATRVDSTRRGARDGPVPPRGLGCLRSRCG